MNRSTAQKRPWLAAALAIPVTGLGHIYLRRWQRAVGWLLVAMAATALFVPPEVIENAARLSEVSLWDVAPMLFVVSLSAADAYLLARQQNVVTEIRSAERCPHCYHELDGNVSFCPWCASELPDGHHEGDH